MKKRILSALLALCMVLSLVLTASAAETSGTCGEGLTWSFADGTLTISGTGAMEDYYDMGETPRKAPWSGFSKDITGLVIGSGVTYIGIRAFANTSLTVLDLSGTNITAIGSEAFSNSTLTSVVLPKGLTEIPAGLFMNCSKLKSVGIPGSVKSIGANAFMTCPKLDYLTVPASVTSMADTAFYLGPDVLFFEGNAPGNTLYLKERATVYYPENNSTWNQDYFDNTWGTQIKNGAVSFRPYTPFTDVPSDSWCSTAVAWATSEDITQGTSATTFSPDANCTRAQVVTFLWRSFGEPQPSTTENPFTDVKPDDYYYNAVLWAVENHITVGTSATTFSPDASCTRAQVATFLWRTNGEPSSQSGNPFADVAADDYFYLPVLWAVEKGITVGTSAATFSPDDTCTRAQIVTFLYRAPRF